MFQSTNIAELSPAGTVTAPTGADPGPANNNGLPHITAGGEAGAPIGDRSGPGTEGASVESDDGVLPEAAGPGGRVAVDVEAVVEVVVDAVGEAETGSDVVVDPAP